MIGHAASLVGNPRETLALLPNYLPKVEDLGFEAQARSFCKIRDSTVLRVR